MVYEGLVMSIAEKTVEIKKVITMICELLPVIVTVIKEVLVLLKDIKTV